MIRWDGPGHAPVPGQTGRPVPGRVLLFAGVRLGELGRHRRLVCAAANSSGSASATGETGETGPVRAAPGTRWGSPAVPPLPAMRVKPP